MKEYSVISTIFSKFVYINLFNTDQQTDFNLLLPYVLEKIQHANINKQSNEKVLQIFTEMDRYV